jgi:4-hydroxybenzoate polyprenyltransferase
METGDLSTSPSGNLPAYVRTRFPAWLAILLPLLLVLLALRERVIDPAELAAAFVLALLLVFELRLWDDVCDRELDRQVHPERVLCRAETVRPFVGLLLFMMGVNFTLVTVLRPWSSVVVLLALHLLLAAWYAARKQLFFLGRIANYHVVLLKYPVIVGILAARPTTDWASPPLLFSMAVVYLGLCIFEVAHDAALRRLPVARICLAVECLVLAAVGCLAVMSAG